MVNKFLEFFSLTSSEFKIILVILLIETILAAGFLIWLHAVINSIGQ